MKNIHTRAHNTHLPFIIIFTKGDKIVNIIFIFCFYLLIVI